MPPVSEAQRKAMEAAASGNSNIGIPKKVGKEYAAADPGGKLPNKAPPAKSSGGGHGYGHNATQRSGKLRMSGHGGAHCIGKKK